jgi:hypothetical protein
MLTELTTAGLEFLPSALPSNPPNISFVPCRLLSLCFLPPSSLTK